MSGVTIGVQPSHQLCPEDRAGVGVGGSPRLPPAAPLPLGPCFPHAGSGSQHSCVSGHHALLEHWNQDKPNFVCVALQSPGRSRASGQAEVPVPAPRASVPGRPLRRARTKQQTHSLEEAAAPFLTYWFHMVPKPAAPSQGVLGQETGNPAVVLPINHINTARLCFLVNGLGGSCPGA